MSRDYKAMAEAFRVKCAELGFEWIASGCVLRLMKRIVPDSASAFADAETDASIILGMVPQTEPGSVWGTDGLSVGGASAMATGNFRMNKSGVSRRFMAALASRSIVVNR